MLPFDLSQIETFLALCDELNFTRAAERVGVSPSRVSQKVRELEARIGGQLFERTSRSVALTPLGERLHAELPVAYRALEGAAAVARDAASGVAGRLRLAVYLPTVGGPHMHEIIKTFHAAQPACRLQVIDRPVGEVIQALRDRDADLIVMRLPFGDPEFSVGPVLTREPRVVVVAADHALAGRTSVGYEEIGDYLVNDVPAFPRETMDHFVPPRTPSGRTVSRIAVADISAIITRVATGEMVHPTVPSFTTHLGHHAIVTVPIRDLPPSETALVRRSVDDRPIVREFLRIASEVMREHPL